MFALFSAWYFWITKILGLTYNTFSGIIHFWILFVGVNVLAPLILFYTKNSYKIYIYFIRIIIVNIVILLIWPINAMLFNGENFYLTKNYLTAKLVEVNNISNNENLLNIVEKASQRLNAKDIQWFVGFTDGDGCLTVYREKKYPYNLRHEFSIGLHITDVALLYKIKTLLCCGIVRKYNNVCIFKIKKINHLLYNIIPIFDRYPLLSEIKRKNYFEFRNSFLIKILHSKTSNSMDKIYSKYLLDNTPYYMYNINLTQLINNTNLCPKNYFDNWIVGFTEAEGSFYFIKDPVYKENYLRAEFRLSQNNNVLLLYYIKTRLKLTRNVELQTNSNNHYYIIATSVTTIQNIIRFFNNPLISRLKGNKNLKFNLWLKGIKNMPRYSNIKL